MTALPWRLPPLAHPTGVASITPRQADVLAGICAGHRNSVIAAHLNVTEDTIKTHCAGLFQALAADNRAHAAALAASGQVLVIVRGAE